MALREELDNYNAEIVIGPEDDPQVTNAQLAVEEWNRTTVADGAWLQQNAIGPLSARDIVLANAIDDTNDALSALSAQMTGLDGRSLKSVNGRFFSGGEAWEGSKDAVVPDGTSVKNDETVYIPKNDEVILSMNDNGGHSFQLQLKPNEIGYRRLAGSNTAEAEGDYGNYKYDTQAGDFRSLVMNATESGNFVVTSAGLQKLECDDVTLEFNEDGQLALKDGPGIWFTSNDIIDKTGATQEDGFYHGSDYKLKSTYSNTIASGCSGYTNNDMMYGYSFTDALAYNSVFGGLSHVYLNALNSSADSSTLSLLMLDNSTFKSGSENIVNATSSDVGSCNYNIINVKDTEFKNAQSVLALADTSLNAEQRTTIQSINHALLAVADSNISATYYTLMIGEDLTAIRGGATYSVLMGKDHTVSGNTSYNYINGVNNTIEDGAQYGMFVGSGNIVTGGVPNIIVNGDENEVVRTVKNSFILGNKNSLHDTANYDIILGDENEAYGTSNNVIIAGNKNLSHNTVVNSLIFGNENELQYGISAVGVFGDGNSLKENVGYSLALGNNIEMSHRISETDQKYAVGMGENIKVKGNYKHVAGNNTQAWNHYQLVLGKDSEDVAEASVLVGTHSKIACTDNAVLVGDHTFVSTSNSMAVGSHNLIMGPASFAAGRGLWTRNAGQVMFGQYAVSYVDSMLEIGMGSEDQTRTVFRIDKNGNVWITGELHCGNISAGSVTTGQSAPVMNGGVAYYNDATTWYSDASAWIAQ